jgi:hypothetical protein
VLSVPAIQGLAKEAANRLAREAYWQPAFDGATVHLTEFVCRLPDCIDAYYIVDFQIGLRQTARLAIDASTGEVGEIAGVDDPQYALPMFMPRSEVASRLRELTAALKKTPILPFDVTKAALDQHLVWKSCDQSRTPFLPFYVVRDGPREVYVRADGVAFSELTNLGAG